MTPNAITAEMREADAEWADLCARHGGRKKQEAIFTRLARLSRGAAKVQEADAGWDDGHSPLCHALDGTTIPKVANCNCGWPAMRAALDAMLGGDDA